MRRWKRILRKVGAAALGIGLGIATGGLTLATPLKTVVFRSLVGGTGLALGAIAPRGSLASILGKYVALGSAGKQIHSVAGQAIGAYRRRKTWQGFRRMFRL